MSHRVLSGPTSHAVGEAVVAISSAVAAAPDHALLARLHETPWPVADAESLRGIALLEESQLSAEALERLHRDHERLFVGRPERGPVASAAAPATAESSLARLRFELAQAGLSLPSPTGADLADALHALAVLLTAPPCDAVLRRRHELLDEHLLTWGARCLSRVQLGAQTFCYQGVATLGLGMLRRATEAERGR